ncbi:MAG: thioredoxin [Acidimicrobiia bacterium]
MTEPLVATCPGCAARNRVPASAPGTPRCAKCHADLPWVVDATEGTMGEIADQAKVPVLVDLWAPWCGPCRMVSPALEQLAREQAGKLKLVKVNVDVAPGVQRRFAVRGIPTLVLLSGGREVSRKVGAAPLPDLRAWVASALAQAAATR